MVPSGSDGAGALDELRHRTDAPAWDLRSSPWNYGPLVIHVDRLGDGEVTCYVPPGTSAYGEHGLGLARWRCARWLAEPAFVEAREPEWVEEIDVGTVRAQVPEDFHRWAGHVTASHVARLRAFARHRPGATAAWTVLHELEAGLEALWPGTIRRQEDDLHAEAMRSMTLASPVVPRPADVVRLTAMSWHDRASVARQAALLGALYAVYRQFRPDDFDFAALGLATGSGQPLQDLAGAMLQAYSLLHVPFTATFLAWVYFRRHSTFAFVRNVMLLVAALVMTPYALDVILGSFDPRYAPAVPIVHVGIALTIGVTGCRLASKLVVRMLFAAYPVLVMCLALASAQGTAEPAGLLLAILVAQALTAIAFLVARLVGAGLTDHRLAAAWHQPSMLAILQRLARVGHPL